MPPGFITSKLLATTLPFALAKQFLFRYIYQLIVFVRICEVFYEVLQMRIILYDAQ